MNGLLLKKQNVRCSFRFSSSLGSQLCSIVIRVRVALSKASTLRPAASPACFISSRWTRTELLWRCRKLLPTARTYTEERQRNRSLSCRKTPETCSRSVVWNPSAVGVHRSTKKGSSRNCVMSTSVALPSEVHLWHSHLRCGSMSKVT